MAVPVAGTVRNMSTSQPISGARVTLFSADLGSFREQRTQTSGSYEFDYIGEGNYRLGVAAPGYEYQERGLSGSNVAVSLLVELGSETSGGRWKIVGDTEP